MSDDATESAATNNSKLQPSIICMPQLQPQRSAALDTQILESGMNEGLGQH